MPEHVDVLVIIQARHASSRLPGKILLEIGGKPLIQHTIERAKAAKNVDVVLLATSANPDNDAVEELCKKIGTPCFRGSEEDVLGRFVAAAEPYAPRLVVRICGDEPLLDPDLLERAIAQHDAAGADYSTTIGAVPNGLDVEVVTYPTLKAAAAEATDPADREHVTKFIVDRKERFRCHQLRFGAGLARPEIKLTVDTQDDYGFILALSARLTTTSAEEIIRLVDSGAVRPKPLILLRADATKGKGIGDVVTLLNIAEGLKGSFRFVFATHSAPEAIGLIKRNGFTVLELADPHAVEQIRGFCARNGIGRAIVELVPNDENYLSSLSDFLTLMVVDFEGGIDPHCDTLLQWDLLPPPLPYRLSGEPMTLFGPDYVPLSPVLKDEAKRTHAEEAKRITVTMGGSDPHDLTLALIPAIRSFPDHDWTIIIGPAFRKEEELGRLLAGTAIRTIRSPPDIHRLLAASDLVVANGGFTAFELCALRVPFVGVTAIPWEKRRLAELERRGACLLLDNEKIEKSLRAALDRLRTRAARESMAAQAAAIVDGEGIWRIAAAVTERWK